MPEEQAEPVIEALYPEEPWRAKCALRLSVGPESLDDAQIDAACTILDRVVARAT